MVAERPTLFIGPARLPSGSAAPFPARNPRTHQARPAAARLAANLERGIAVLKQSFEATLRAALVASDPSGQRDDVTMRNELSAAREQVVNWRASIAERDARIRNLGADLTFTRRRLDEAILQIKAAGTR